MTLEQMQERVRKEWKCACDVSCDHINEDNNIEDLIELVTEVWNEAIKEGERKILNTEIVGWDVDISQPNGTTCKWRLIQRFNTDPDNETPLPAPRTDITSDK